MRLLRKPVREYINHWSSRHKKRKKKKKRKNRMRNRHTVQTTVIHLTTPSSFLKNVTNAREPRLKYSKHVAKLKEIVSDKLKRPFEEVKYSQDKKHGSPTEGKTFLLVVSVLDYF